MELHKEGSKQIRNHNTTITINNLKIIIMKTINSWMYQKVRIKEEYIKTEIAIDEDASTYDDDDNIIEEVSYQYEYIDTPNGLNGVYGGREREIFDVKYNCYGVDLYGKGCMDIDIDKLPEPSHLIVIGNRQTDYPYMWDAKYFEVVTTETTTIYVADDKFKTK